MKLLFVVLILSLTQLDQKFNEVRVVYVEGEKKVYDIGDEVKLSIYVRVPPETCEDGLSQIKLFQQGISIVKQERWSKYEDEIWEKEILLKITGNKKKYGQLTIMRRVDKQSFLHQEKFPYSK